MAMRSMPPTDERCRAHWQAGCSVSIGLTFCRRPGSSISSFKVDGRPLGRFQDGTLGTKAGSGCGAPIAESVWPDRFPAKRNSMVLCRLHFASRC